MANNGKVLYLILSIRKMQYRIIAAGKIKSSKQQQYFVVADPVYRKNGDASFGGGTEVLNTISQKTYEALKSGIKYSVK